VGDGERERETETETERDRQTGRDTDRQRQRERQAETDRERETRSERGQGFRTDHSRASHSQDEVASGRGSRLRAKTRRQHSRVRPEGGTEMPQNGGKSVRRTKMPLKDAN